MRRLSTKAWLVLVFFALLGAYVLFQARFIILGPEISIQSPRDGATVPAGLLTLTGTARNIAFISLDDRPIFIDQHGNWSEKLLVPAGLSIMTIKASDRFGRETTKTLEIAAE